VPYRDLPPNEAFSELENDPTLRVLDVRTDFEHRSHRLPAAQQLIPVQELAERSDELDPEANWLVYCEHGRRSVVACRLLADLGFRRLANLRGGMAHWAHAGLPMDR